MLMHSSPNRFQLIFRGHGIRLKQLNKQKHKKRGRVDGDPCLTSPHMVVGLVHLWTGEIIYTGRLGCR